MLRILQFLLLIAGDFLLAANFEPYIAITKLVFTDGNGIDVCDTLTFIPFIGRLFAWGCGLVAGTIYGLSGFIVWAVFQIIELLLSNDNYNRASRQLEQMLKRLSSASIGSTYSCRLIGAR